MNQLVVTRENLPDLVKKAKTDLVPWPPQRPRINVLAEGRRETYYKVNALFNVWEWLYKEHLHPAMKDPKRAEEASRQIDAIIDEFDAAAIALAPVGATHKKVTEQMEALKNAVRRKPRVRRLARLTGDTPDLAKERWRKRIRTRSRAVMKGLQKMRDEAANPAWLRRKLNDLGFEKLDQVFVVDSGENERVRRVGKAIFEGTIQKITDKLFNPEVADAFQILGLTPSATLQDVQERYRDLKHRPGGDKNEATNLDKAYRTLETRYYRSAGSSSGSGEAPKSGAKEDVVDAEFTEVDAAVPNHPTSEPPEPRGPPQAELKRE